MGRRAVFLVVMVLVVVGMGMKDPIGYCHASAGFVNNARAGFQLLQTQMMIRHGDRTPVYYLSPDLEKNAVWNCSDSIVQDADVEGGTDSLRIRKNFLQERQALNGNCMLGQLTGRGEEQLQKLGQRFRALYVDSLHLLPPVLDASVMSLRSTDVERTIRSAYHFLTGLYPNSSALLDIDVVEKARDNAFPNGRFCPQLRDMSNRIKSSRKYQEYYARNLASIQRMLEAGWKEPVNLFHLNDILRARMCHNLPYPPGVSHADATAIMHGISQLFSMIDETRPVQKFGIGSFFADWLKNFELQPRPRFVLYSNHDSTMRVLLEAMKVRKVVWPPYASHVAFELWENESDGVHYIAAQYDGEPMPLPPPCPASGWCPYEKFAALLKSFESEECSHSATDFDEKTAAKAAFQV